jgi:DNA polymerase II small subunit
MESVIKAFSAHGTLIQPDTLDYILAKENPKEFTEAITKHLKEYALVLTLEHIKSIEEKTKTLPIAEPSVKQKEEKELQHKILSSLYETKPLQTPHEIEIDENDDFIDIKTSMPMDVSEEENRESLPIVSCAPSWNPPSKQYDADVKIIKDITGKSTCEGNTTDFAKLFANRFSIVRKILRKQRRELAQVIPINRMKSSGIKDIQVVGIVNEIRTTTNGHRLIELEDDTGSITAIVLQNARDLFQTAQTIVPDEIIGISGQFSNHGDLFLIQSIIYPDISLHNTYHKTSDPICTAFLSDIHIGSKEFMDKQWQSFIKWITGNLGNSRQKDVAGKIKYIVIPGDVVDGIGIYPNQEHELVITDLYKQYEASQLSFNLEITMLFALLNPNPPLKKKYRTYLMVTISRLSEIPHIFPFTEWKSFLIMDKVFLILQLTFNISSTMNLLKS